MSLEFREDINIHKRVCMISKAMALIEVLRYSVMSLGNRRDSEIKHRDTPNRDQGKEKRK